MDNNTINQNNKMKFNDKCQTCLQNKNIMIYDKDNEKNLVQVFFNNMVDQYSVVDNLIEDYKNNYT